MVEIEYRVRPVTRYVLTRYFWSDDTGSVDTIGEFDNVKNANSVCNAMALAEEGAKSAPIQIGGETSE